MSSELPSLPLHFTTRLHTSRLDVLALYTGPLTLTPGGEPAPSPTSTSPTNRASIIVRGLLLAAARRMISMWCSSQRTRRTAVTGYITAGTACAGHRHHAPTPTHSAAQHRPASYARHASTPWLRLTSQRARPLDLCAGWVGMCCPRSRDERPEWQLSQKRRENLETGQELQRFLQNSDELEEWMLERLTIAQDVSWQDDASSTFQVQTVYAGALMPLLSPWRPSCVRRGARASIRQRLAHAACVPCVCPCPSRHSHTRHSHAR